MTGPLADEPRVFTIAPGVPFLPTLADALLDGTLVPGFPDSGDPLALAAATIFLPTRRAARALTALLADRAGAAARLLPRIVPLGDADAAELAFDDGDLDAESHAGLPPPIGEVERRLVLTQMVLAFARSMERARLTLASEDALLVPSSPSDAYALAGDLARLMDQLTTDGIGWEKLAGIVEERYDRYFSLTLEFLEIAAKAWPRYLEECGAIDPVRRRNLVLRAAAERLGQQGFCSGPIVAAGSTGSVPAAAHLMAAISRTPKGAVVLPGLDTSLDEQTWDMLSSGRPGEPAHGHPQLAMQRLLAKIGTTRGAVRSLGSPSRAAAARNRFLGEALRPAGTTERWASLRTQGGGIWSEALHDLALVEAADEREEALVASVAIREALETEGATAALVTPDRGLAERVAFELKRWSIDVEDSAGVPLTRTLPGRLALLAASCAVSEHAPRDLIGLLAHPFVTLGWPRSDVEAGASALEIGVLRGPAAPMGLAGLRTSLSDRKLAARSRHAPLPVKRLTASDWELIEALIGRLDRAFAEFRFERERTYDFVELASRHRTVLTALTETSVGEPDQFGEDEAGEALEEMFEELALCGAGRVVGTAAQYPAFLTALAGERPVRRRRSGHRRVHIWGLLEARLLEADLVVAGGLDEGVWPPAVKTDAFLNRPMRASLGLESPERRIGQTAHDLGSTLGCRRVVITRSLKREGAPTVPSRFIQRMAAVAGELSWKGVVAAGARYRALAKALDRRAERVRAVPRPAPKPPRDLVPRSLSVTEIETLVRDPYSIFARHVLKLDQLDGLAMEPGAADRGTIVHDVIGRFTMDHPRQLPPDALARILDGGKQAFTGLAAFPGLAAQWWPRFARLVEAFLRWEALRRPDLEHVSAEVSGALDIRLATEETFVLRARADRIEQHRGGSFTIVDFKTGTPPSSKAVFAGFAPQLTLEAAMLTRGAFEGIGRAQDASSLLYLHATGGTPPVVPCPIEPPQGETRSVSTIIEQHLAKLETLMSRYVSGDAGFMARPYAQYARRFNEYDHLARTREWSLAADEAEDPQ